jgi:ACS family tartrate transporter-like MFS transporter
MPTAFLRGTAAAGGIAFVNSVGNVGGFVGPIVVGWIRDATGGFAAGLVTLAGVLVVGAVVVLVMPRSRTLQ